MIVEDLITSVLTTFSYNDLDLSLRPVLCFLYQVNAKLQCKKIKKNNRWTDFQMSGACKVKEDIKKSQFGRNISKTIAIFDTCEIRCCNRRRNFGILEELCCRK